MSDVFVAIILGLVEGLTEFLPVSSTGHLIIAGELLGFSDGISKIYSIIIQSGAILAVVLLYWKKFKGLLKSDSEDSFSGSRGIIIISAACLPAFILGALLHDRIKALLFNPTSVAAALIFGGIIMIALDSRDRRSSVRELGEITARQAMQIGLIQCLALWPGMSRSAATIIGGMLLGLERKVAAEFSFIVAVPVLLGATVFEFYGVYNDLAATMTIPFLVGLFVSFLSAVLAIKSFLVILSSWSFRPFGIYRIIAGVVVILIFNY